MKRYGYYDAHHPRIIKSQWVSFWLGVAFVLVLTFVYIYFTFKPIPIISPCPDDECYVAPTPTSTPKPKATASLVALRRPTIGKASYYSIDGCLGCNPGRIMANGKRLDDTKLTVAYNHAPLNTKVKIRNTKTGASVTATISDRGGFERHGKIADLSVATRDALGCGDVCPIELVW